MKKFFVACVLGLVASNGFAKDLPHAKERWDAIYKLVDYDVEVIVNIGTEFPAGWLGLEVGQHKCFKDKVTGKKMIQIIPGSTPVVQNVVQTSNPVIQSSYTPINYTPFATPVCKTCR